MGNSLILILVQPYLQWQSCFYYNHRHSRCEQYYNDDEVGDMMALISEWVVTIISLIIFTTFIEILIPNSNYKRYIDVVMGFFACSGDFDTFDKIHRRAGRF